MLKGDNVATNEPVTKSYYRLYRREEWTGQLASQLFQCDDETAPTRWTTGMSQLCRVEYTPDISYAGLEDFTSASTGEDMKKLNYELELKPSGASAEFAVLMNGKRQANKNVDISFQ